MVVISRFIRVFLHCFVACSHICAGLVIDVKMTCDVWIASSTAITDSVCRLRVWRGVTTPRRGGVTLLYCWVLILASGCTNAVDVDAVLMSGALLAYRQGCHHSYDIAGSIVRPAGGVVPIVISAPDKPVSRLIVTSVQKLPQLFVDTISENIYIVSGGF